MPSLAEAAVKFSPGNTLVLSDLKPPSTNVTRFRTSSGAFRQFPCSHLQSE
jgi:hypothetical protein